MDVIFKIVGRNQHKWHRAMKRLDYSRMLQEVKDHTDLTPGKLDVGYDDTENVGLIFADNVVAGTFTIGTDASCTPIY